MQIFSLGVIGPALLALQASAALQTPHGDSPSRTTLEPRQHLLAPTTAPTPRLQERQFLCHLFGNCRTTTVTEDGPANPKATADSSATSESSAESTSSASSTSTTITSSSTTTISSSSSSVSSAPSTTSSPSSTSSASSSASSSSVSSSTSTSSSSSVSSSSSSTSLSQSVVTVTSIVTGSDGSQSTSLSASSTAVAVPVQNSANSSGLSGKTWGIIGGVVGGVAALLIGLFVIWRCTKRRSSKRAMDDLSWPELQNDATGGAFSVLNPPGTRNTGGAGFEMEKDRAGGEGDYYDDEDDDRDHGAGEYRGGGYAGAGGAVSPRLAYDPRSSAQYYGSEGGQYGYMPDYGQLSRNYYDPYHQEAPLPPLPPTAAAYSDRHSPGLPAGAGPPSPALPYPGSPIRSSEMVVDSAYPPRSSRLYSAGGAEDPYGGYAGMSTDDVPLTAAAQRPAGAGAGAGIPYHGSSGASPYGPAR
ncbi:hypothetical protein JCM10908_006232 [Rhodotorula pacifica]|uniref:uncharacterized protein n=1 Tax=Rhodotorula pacifica TaxID=1495444 RepID=UPI00318227D7